MKPMKRIEARDQVALGPARGLQLALGSMSHRMFRSGITISILALAVAFLVHMVAHGILSQETQRAARQELSLDRELGEHITRLGSPDADAVIYDQLYQGNRGRLLEMQTWADGDGEFERARATSTRLHEIAAVLLDLPVSVQAVLLADLSPAELFARLDTQSAVDGFTQSLRQLKVNVPGLEPAALRHLFLEEVPAMQRVIARVAAGHRRAIQRVHEAYPNSSPSELAIAPPDDLLATLQGAGFQLDARSLSRLQDFARREAELRRMGTLLLNSEVRATVARETRVAPGDVSFDVLLEQVEDKEGATWLVNAMRAVSSELEFDAARVLNLLDRARRRKRLLVVAGEDGEVNAGGVFGLDERNQWLLALSFLVCVVGVANAMLMSVTERFTEIATMKCLGAMDRFVMVMFVFEALVQGAIGGLIGVVIGIVLALLRGFAEFGGLLVNGFGALGELALGVTLSLLLGIVLAAVAAVGPSWIAARLLPMEAMRVD